MKLLSRNQGRRSSKVHGGSLPEVLIAITVLLLSSSAIVTGYVLSANRAEWSAYSLAAHSIAMQRLEQARAAKWDPYAYPAADEVQATNFPVAIEVLDVPISGTNIVYATNRTTISTVSSDPPLKMVKVECSWRFTNRGVFTNTIVAYRAPDQ